MTVLQKSQISALRERGLSYLEIAEKVGVPKNTVKTFCRRSAITAVNASDAFNESINNDKCLHCQTPLTKARSTKKFCTDKCRLAWNKANRKPSAVCACCGEKFDNNGNALRKYCSNACYISHRFPPQNAEVVAV